MADIEMTHRSICVNFRSTFLDDLIAIFTSYWAINVGFVWQFECFMYKLLLYFINQFLSILDLFLVAFADLPMLDHQRLPLLIVIQSDNLLGQRCMVITAVPQLFKLEKKCLVLGMQCSYEVWVGILLGFAVLDILPNKRKYVVTCHFAKV